MEKINAIVPCYNEAPRLGRVLKTLSSSPLIDKIVFVDDGSSDNSVEVAQSFPKVQVVVTKQRGGKGQAVREGFKHVEGAAVFLCDADLRGLKETHIQKMFSEYQKNPHGLVVGLTEKSGLRAFHWLRSRMFVISGERIISAKDLKKVLESPLSDDYGIEPYMNYYFLKKKQPVVKVLLEGVNDLPKTEKEGHGWNLHLTEGKNIFTRYVQIYAKEAPRDVYRFLKD